MKKFFTSQKLINLLPYVLCFLFFLAYTTLSLVRHQHFQSFGFDLGINDQVIWEYSKFQSPITTIDHIPFVSKLIVHVELIYSILAPFYWIWSDPKMLLILQALLVTSSGIPMYLLARKYHLSNLLATTLLLSYLTFYGVQNALWFDFHSSAIGAGFLAWFIYFLDKKSLIWSEVAFILTIFSKENFAAYTLLVSLVYFLKKKEMIHFFYIFFSIVYLFILFGLYFPYVIHGYRFEHQSGLFSNINLTNLFDTQERRAVWFYSFFWVGFLPLLSPVLLLPAVGNIASYFLLGSDVSTAQGLFLQYRISLAPFITWATILTIAQYTWLNKRSTAIYLLACVLFIQYTLHLPLSYLTKSWFWYNSPSVESINKTIQFIPKNASVVSQNNITPHISERNQIFTLYPEKGTFTKNSPCGKKVCNWFRWEDSPSFLIVDTSPEWDIRHFLADKDQFIDGLKNLEATKVIVVDKKIGTTTLYRVLKNPDKAEK